MFPYSVAGVLSKVIGIVPYTFPIVNPSPGTTAGWINQTGSISIRRHFFDGGQGSSVRAYQQFNIPAEYLGTNSNITLMWDAGDWSGDADHGEMEIQFRDAGNGIISNVGSGLATYEVDPSAATRQTFIQSVPANATSVRCVMHGVRQGGTDLNAYWDNIEMTISLV